MQMIALANVVGLAIEVAGVALLVRIDVKERAVLEAQTNLQKAHDAYLQNMTTDSDGHYQRRRNRPQDRRIVDSYDPRQSRAGFRVSLWLLCCVMAIQVGAAMESLTSGEA